MAKKIYLSPSSQKENTYATGNTNEQAQCRKIASACAKFLKKQGFKVKCANYGTMYSRTEESNKWGADLHVAIHTNATGKHNITGGTQIYLNKLDGEHKKVGQAVFDRLAPLSIGTSHERLVENSTFYEIKCANAITVYCECEFHDTIDGAENIITNTKAFGEAIAKGVCDYYGIKVKTTKIKPKKYSGQMPILPEKGYLEKGDSGAEVKKWQKYLVWYGYKIDVDGSFGINTEKATIDFQTKMGFAKKWIDGLVGSKTIKQAKKIKK